jgi:hypothetical protein
MHNGTISKVIFFFSKKTEIMNNAIFPTFISNVEIVTTFQSEKVYFDH